MIHTSLYFLAIVPPSDISEKIEKIKLYVAEKYNCKQALKSPPHITIQPPFPYASKKETFLLDNIDTFNDQIASKTIPIHLNNYNVFLPRVVFINVVNHPSLIHLYEQVQHFVKTNLNVLKDLPPRPFHPHITIAFRDLKKHLTLSVLEDITQKFPVTENFTSNKISLLKHDGQQWNIIL